MKLYTIMDKKAGTYGSVMMAPNDALIVRTLEERVGPNETLSRFAEDFDLYEVGEFDDQTGRISENGVRFVLNMAVVFRKGGV